MSVAALERLVHKYDGYVADLEGSGVAVLDLLFVRDRIQAILHRLTPDAALPPRCLRASTTWMRSSGKSAARSS